MNLKKQYKRFPLNFHDDMVDATFTHPMNDVAGTIVTWLLILLCAGLFLFFGWLFTVLTFNLGG
jgi:hypothetical protein